MDGSSSNLRCMGLGYHLGVELTRLQDYIERVTVMPKSRHYPTGAPELRKALDIMQTRSGILKKYVDDIERAGCAAGNRGFIAFQQTANELEKDLKQGLATNARTDLVHLRNEFSRVVGQ